MPDLALITSIPEVRSGVLSDPTGALLDSFNEPDGESVAAVIGFLANTMGQAGEQLGLGQLERISCSSEQQACVLVVEPTSIACAFVESPRALPAVERTLDGAQQGHECWKRSSRPCSRSRA